jgi:hypothetical protein
MDGGINDFIEELSTRDEAERLSTAGPSTLDDD